MWKRFFAVVGMALLLGACDNDNTVFVPVDEFPAPPEGLEGEYFNQAITLHWFLGAQWNGESFRVYGRRVGDASFLVIAEVTSCADGACEYTDTNIVESVSYEYFVSSVDPDTGAETDSDAVIVVSVPSFIPPPVPSGIDVVALDDTNYIRWSDNARSASDFSHYRVYLLTDGGATLLGETDSEGFLDELAENGVTSTYVVSSVDVYGHESLDSFESPGTPRPDFRGELVVSFADNPARSGFRFAESDELDPIVSGSSPSRHFRLETDAIGWWLVPGPSADIFPEGTFTTALKCGVAADPQCQDWTIAPTSGYTGGDVFLEPELTYMLRVVGDDGQLHYGAIRVALLGTDQTGAEIMIFDWAYQLQAGNPQLVGR